MKLIVLLFGAAAALMLFGLSDQAAASPSLPTWASNLVIFLGALLGVKGAERVWRLLEERERRRHRQAL
jgi:hypothetical protein